MTLGEIIKKYRTDKNISLRKFAEISGLSHSYVDSLEKNFEHSTKKSITPSTETIEKVANALNVDIIDMDYKFTLVHKLIDYIIYSKENNSIDIYYK